MTQVGSILMEESMSLAANEVSSSNDGTKEIRSKSTSEGNSLTRLFSSGEITEFTGDMYVPLFLKTIFRWRRVVIAFWLLLLWPSGYYCYTKLVHNTDDEIPPPDGSDSKKAEDVYEDAYLPPGKSENKPITIALEQKDVESGGSMTEEGSLVYNVTSAFIEEYSEFIINLKDPGIVSVSDYYSTNAVGVHTYAIESFTANNGSITLMVVTNLIDKYSSRRNFFDDVKEYGEDNAPAELEISFAGFDASSSDVTDLVEEDMRMMDMVSVPLALLVLFVVLDRNCPLLLIPTVQVITSFMGSCILMYPISESMRISNFVLSIMLSMTIAMSIDYTLFILSRTLEELDNGMELIPAVVNAYVNAAHVILVSGATIMICLFTMVLLPIIIFVGVGLGAGISILFCVFVSMTLLPALLFSTYGKKVFRCSCKKKKSTKVKQETDLMTTPLLHKNESSDTARTALEIEEEENLNDLQDDKDNLINETPTAEEIDTNGFWFQMGKQWIQWPRSIVIFSAVVCVCILPVGYYIFEMETSISNELWLPDTADSMEAHDLIADSFGEGAVAPYSILFDGSDTNQNITTRKGFDVMHLVQQSFSLNADFSSPDDIYNGIAYWNYTSISYDTYQQALACYSSCEDENLLTVAFLDQQQTSKDGQTTYIRFIQWNTDPYSTDGVDWLTSARDIIDDLEDQGQLQGYKVHLLGGSSVDYDCKVETYKYFPFVVIFALITVLLFLMCFFRSFVAALRSVVSILFTLSFSYGLLVLVYQKGILDWTGITAVTTIESSPDQNDGEIHYLPPVMAFNICVGLSLDYDIFYISRILEFRLFGWDDTSSILLGLQGTGRIITAAGCIMALAFGGLLLSSIPILDQFGFLLASSVFLDTFVIRTIIVPILFSWTDIYSWWPRSLPTPHKSALAEEQ